MSLHHSLAPSSAPVSGLIASSFLTSSTAEEPNWPETFHVPGTAMTYAPDQEIYGENLKADMFFRIVAGTVRICKFLANGNRQIEAFHMEGEIFGLDAFEKYRFSAEAVSSCTLIAYRRRILYSAVVENSTLSQCLFAHVLRDAARAQDHSLLLGRRGAVEKVGTFLLDCTGRTGKSDIVNLEMPRADIADYLGLTIETVSRTLSKLERDGVIELATARNIKIRKPASLQMLRD